MRRLLALVAAACLLTAACTADDSGSDAVETTTSTSITTTSLLAAIEVTGVVQGDAETISGEFSGEPIAGSGESWTSARDVVYRSAFTDMSDDRVNGEYEHVMDMDLTAEGDRFIASLTITSLSITNEGGSWGGTGEGTSIWTKAEPLHVHNIDYTLIGTGDYDGLQFTFHVADQGDYPWDITGTIKPVDG